MLWPRSCYVTYCNHSLYIWHASCLQCHTVKHCTIPDCGVAYCPRGPWWTAGRHLFLLDSEVRAFERRETPAWVATLYGKLHVQAELVCRPELLWLEHAGGAGALWLGDAIAVGVADVRRIAIELVERYLGLRVLTPRESLVYRGPRHSLAEYEAEVIRVLLAHELGHARLHQDQNGSLGVREELLADVWAGYLASAMGWDPSLHHLIFHSIGCVGPACTHPSPDARMAAYVRGRQLREQWQLQRWRPYAAAVAGY
jgi:hypothetical protein